MIHKTAIIEGDVKIGDNVNIGPYAYISGNIEIGDNSEIGHCVQIEGNVKIGKGNKIFHSAYIGAPPQDVAYEGGESSVEVGDNNILREYVQIHRGTKKGTCTKLGSNCFLMGGAHLAHNVSVGNSVIIANNTLLGGYVELDDFSFVSGLCAFHQFVKIGKYVMIGGLTGISKDCPPYMTAVGYPAKIIGINLVGLKRNGFSGERRKVIKDAYKLIYRSGKNVTQAVKELSGQKDNPDILELIEFIEKSERGLLK